MAHSPLGGSVASRFIKCPGSHRLIQSMPALLDADPLLDEWQGAGTAAHELAAVALKENVDAWELADHKFSWPCTAEDQIAVQVYLDYVRSRGRLRAEQFVERPVFGYSYHKHLFGTCDWAQYDPDEAFLEIVDYKHGAGVVVSVYQNAQLLYYAFCKLLEHPATRRVRMTIVQPRGFHPEGTIRHWETDAETVMDWGINVLVPAMKTAEVSDERNPGDVCQFCPAKLYCPEALALFDEASVPIAEGMSDERLNERYSKIPVVAFVRKALEKEVLRRQLLGHKFESAKLVQQKADRRFKDGALTIFSDRFGDAAFTPPELKSPAQMEKLPGAKELVAFWSFKPQTTLVTAQITDKRTAVKPQSGAEVFKNYGETHADTERNQGE